MSTGSLPVIVALSRRAAPGHERALVAWAHDLCDEASQMPGYVSASVRPAKRRPGLEVFVSIHFSSAAALAVWEGSDQRRVRLEEGDFYTAGPPMGVTLEQIDAAIAGVPHRARVSKWRTAVSVWLALYPLALLSSGLLLPHLTELPIAASIAISSSILVALVVWVTLPLVHMALSLASALLANR